MSAIPVIFEWLAYTAVNEQQTVVGSFVIRLTSSEITDLLSRYTEGAPVNTADATAIYQGLIECVAQNQGATPQ